MSVAAGGAFGAVGRYWLLVRIDQWLNSMFPYATLIVNVLGAVAMGLLVAATTLLWSPSDEFRAFLSVGMLGAFTTFSLFSQDMFYLVENGQPVSAVLYAMASVVLCVSGFYAGYLVLRHLFT